MTAADVVYRFQPLGVADTIRAFETVEQAALKHSRAIGAAARSEQQYARSAGKGGPYRSSAGPSMSREEREAQKARDKAEKEEERSIKRRQDYERRQRATHFANLHKAEEKAQRESQRRAERAERERIRSTAQIRSQALGMVGAAVLGAAVGVGAIGAGIVAAGTRRASADRESARRLAINARGAGETMIDPAVLQAEASAVARATPGQTASGVIGAQQKFVGKTGDIGAARSFANTFATVASATGSNIEDIAAAGAELFTKFNVRTVEEMQDALSKLAMQGKAGTFELKDAADQFARMGAAAQRFGGGKGGKGVAELGAFSQIAAKSTGSPEQAATAVEATLRQMIANRGKLKALGVDPLDKQGQGKALSEILPAIVAKVGGKDLGAKKQGLQALFNDEGVRALSPFIDAFGTALQEGKDPIEAMKKMMGDFVDAAGDYDDMLIEAAAAGKDASAQLTLAWETLSAKLSDKMVPMVERLAESLNSGEFDGAIDALVGTAEVLVGAFESLIDVLAMVPGFEKKTLSPEEQLARDQKELARTDKAIKRDMQQRMRENAEEGIVGPVTPDAELIRKRDQLTGRIAKSEKEIQLGQQFVGGAMTPEQLNKTLAENPASADFIKRQQDQAEGISNFAAQTGGMVTKLGDAGKMVPPEFADAARKHQNAATDLANAAKALSDAAKDAGSRGTPDGGAGKRF